MTEKIQLCVVKRCVNEAKSRGLCNACYSSALKLVKANETNWDELIHIGLAVPTPPRPKKESQSRFCVAYRALRKRRSRLVVRK